MKKLFWDNKYTTSSIILIALACVFLFFDIPILEWIAQYRTPLMTEWMIWFSQWGIPISIAYIAISRIACKQYAELILYMLTFGVTYEVTSILKEFFAIPRPLIDAVTSEPSYAFPSMHSAFIALLIPFVKGTPAKIIAILAVICVTFSRMYLGVHTLSQITVGIAVGLLVASSMISTEKKYQWVYTTWQQLKKHLELRRQAMHLSVVIMLAYGIYWQLFSAQLLIFILIGGIIISTISKKYKIPGIEWALNTFERDKNRLKLPGSGVMYLFVSTIAIQYCFNREIVFYALLITAIGDAVSPIVGSFFGKHPLIWNKSKHSEGLIASIVVTTYVLIHMIPIIPALISSSVTMTIESISLKILGSEIDDNIIVPLVAAISLSIVL